MRSNEEIVTIIEERTKEKGMSLSELARQVDMAKSAISRYFNRTREFPLNRVNEFAKVLDLKPEYILGFENDSDINKIYNQLTPPRQSKVYHFAEHQLEEQNRLHTIKVLGQTAAGAPIEYGDVIEEKEVSYVPSGADIALVVNGDSMEPRFKNGSIVFYKKQETLENGELGIFEVNGGVTFKKLKMNGDVRLVSLNDNYDDIVVDENVVFKVLGKVIY